MGLMKDHLIELQERGFGEVPDKYVCSACFANKGIEDFIDRNAVEYFCSYCGKKIAIGKTPIAVSLEDVVGLIMQSISRLYDDPNNCLIWDNEDDCYFGITLDLDEVLSEMGLELTATNKVAYDLLYNDLTNSIDSDIWTPRDGGLLSESESYQLGWERFVSQVKHNSRFVFSLIGYKRDPLDSRDAILPSQMLPKINRLIKSAEMVRMLRKGTIFYRVRVCFQGEKVEDTANDLGVPKSEKAIFSNRMSPSGIPMFYGSLEQKTAENAAHSNKYIETMAKKVSMVKIAEFKLLKDILIIDFTRRHDYCLFEEEINESELNTKAFLNHFINELSKPIERDGREHIEYVPTQIVTEYLKYKCLGNHGERIKGILYPGSRRGGTSCVLFFRNHHCIDKSGDVKDAYLQLTQVKTIRFKTGSSKL